MQLDQHPTFLARMKSGIAYIGNTQFLPGYCVLFAEPQVASLNDLESQARLDFLLDMSLLGDAILAVCKPLRINYGILGNSHPHLHAHLFPRYETEPEERRNRNVWTYPEEYWGGAEFRFSEEKHGLLQGQLAASLEKCMQATYSRQP